MSKLTCNITSQRLFFKLKKKESFRELCKPLKMQLSGPDASCGARLFSALPDNRRKRF